MGLDFKASFWDEGTPSGTSEVRQINEAFASLKSSLRSIVGEEHEFNAAAADHVRGTHLQGSARAYVDVESNMSVSGTSYVGRLYYSSDESHFFLVPDSGFTAYIGSAHAPEILSIHTNLVRPDGGGLGGQYSQNARWVQQVGYTQGSSAAETGVVFKTEYDGQPIVVLGTVAGAGASLTAVLSDVSQGGFDFAVWDENDARTNNSCMWISTGTVSF